LVDYSPVDLVLHHKEDKKGAMALGAAVCLGLTVVFIGIKGYYNTSIN